MRNFSRLLCRSLVSFLLLSSFSCAAWAEEGSSSAPSCPRIVSQSPYLTQALLWLERGDCIVGLSRYDQELQELPRTGGVLDPDKNAIAATRPGLVITSNWASAETLRDITPVGARLLAVDGFASLRDTEAMLATLAEATNAPGAQARIADFAQAWRGMAQEIAPLARKRRLLVLSTCMGTPLSFGPAHVIGDIFVQSGFDLVESAPKVRHFGAGAEFPDIAALVEKTRPEVIVTLTSDSAAYCRMIAPALSTDILPLDGAPFIHPGPGLLKAFREVETALREEAPQAR
jgi:iron complex transport system substrate-binding protein